jgi:hypothetical protein
LRAEVENLKTAAGFVEIRRPDGTVGRYTARDFCGVLDEVRKGTTDNPTVARLIEDLRTTTNLENLDVFCQAVASMAWDYRDTGDAATLPTRRAIPDMSEDSERPPGVDTTPEREAFEAELEAKRAEEERIRTAPLSDLTPAERRQRLAGNRR